jgi:hypothetical protein
LHHAIHFYSLNTTEHVVRLENISDYWLIKEEPSSSLFFLVLVKFPDQQVPILLIGVFVLVEFATT